MNDIENAVISAVIILAIIAIFIYISVTTASFEHERSQFETARLKSRAEIDRTAKMQRELEIRNLNQP